MIEFLVIAVLGGLLLAGISWVVIWRAVGSVFDWVILTFGNEGAVERLKRERGWDTEGPSGPDDRP